MQLLKCICHLTHLPLLFPFRYKVCKWLQLRYHLHQLSVLALGRSLHLSNTHTHTRAWTYRCQQNVEIYISILIPDMYPFLPLPMIASPPAAYVSVPSDRCEPLQCHHWRRGAPPTSESSCSALQCLALAGGEMEHAHEVLMLTKLGRHEWKVPILHAFNKDLFFNHWFFHLDTCS